MRIIQLFNWKLSSIESILDKIQDQGFDTIIINPMQDFKKDLYFHWWDSYQPINFKIGNIFGNEKDLTNLCKEAKRRDINIITEVICDHLAGSGMGFNKLYSNVDKDLKKESFYKPPIAIKNYDDREDSTKHSLELPTLDLTNNELQKIVIEYLEELRKCGVKGYLFNGVKHIGFPTDGVDFFQKVNEYSKMTNTTIIGEFLGENVFWLTEASKYMYIFTHYNTYLNDNSKKIAYIDNPDKYLNHKYYYDYLENDNYLNKYKELCKAYSNTSMYVRTKKNSAYYVDDGIINHCFDIKYKNELTFFDDTLLKDEKVKQSNKISKKELEEKDYKSLIKKLF